MTLLCIQVIHFLEATSVKVLAGLRGLIGLQCVFVYCMSWKTQTPKALGFRGDSGDLAPCCSPNVSAETLGRRVVPSWFSSHGFPFPSPFPDVHLKLGVISWDSEPAPASEYWWQSRPDLQFPPELDANSH